MFSSRGRGFGRFIRIVIDGLNILLGLAVVVLAILAFINGAEVRWMFPLVFILGAAMNLLTGVKYLMTDRRGRGAILIVVAVLLSVIAYVTYYSVGGIL